MFMRMLVAAGIVVSLFNSAQAQRTSVDEATDCRKDDGGDARIAACSRAIVFMYNNRGLAWMAKGDMDRAIADFDEAVRLDPNYVDVYFNRGDAWEEKDNNKHTNASYSDAVRLA